MFSLSPMSLPLAPTDSRKRKRTPKTYKSTFCSVFGSTGSCPKGRQCNFFHDGEDDPLEMRDQGYSPPANARYVSPTMMEYNSSFSKKSVGFSLNPRAPVFVPMGLTKDDLLSEVDKLKDQLKKMREETDTVKSDLAKVSALHKQTLENMDDLFPVPKIVKFDPSVPEFIITKNTVRWVWNSCGTCMTSSMCAPRDFDSVTAKILEDGFVRYSRVKKNNILKYTIPNMKDPYEFNYITMIQTNMTTKTGRLVERTIDTVKTKNPKWVRGLNEIHQVRTYEDQFKTSRSSVIVDSKSKEFKTVEKEFLDTTSGTNPTMRDSNYKIDKIVKTIDPINARLYEIKKSSMKTQDEAMLFHGTRGASVNQIINDGGLDVRVGNDGSYFGRGIYTAASPHYSHTNFGTSVGINGQFKDQSVLLYTKVLLGTLKVFPDDHRDGLIKAPTGFDSVCSNVDQNHTTIYTVYDNHQVYISYMIYYSKNSSSSSSKSAGQ